VRKIRVMLRIIREFVKIITLIRDMVMTSRHTVRVISGLMRPFRELLRIIRAKTVWIISVIVRIIRSLREDIRGMMWTNTDMVRAISVMMILKREFKGGFW
jgi:hypothetical protein